MTGTVNHVINMIILIKTKTQLMHFYVFIYIFLFLINSFKGFRILK